MDEGEPRRASGPMLAPFPIALLLASSLLTLLFQTPLCEFTQRVLSSVCYALDAVLGSGALWSRCVGIPV